MSDARATLAELAWEYAQKATTKTPNTLDKMGMPVRYRPPNSQEVGDLFNFEKKILTRIELPLTKFIRLTDKSVRQFVFATSGTSENFEESLLNVASVQHFFPDRKIVYYDLGLDKDEAETVSN